MAVPEDTRGRILVDDGALPPEDVVRALRRKAFDVERLPSGEDPKEALLASRYDVFLTELDGDGSATVALCEALKEDRPLLDVIVLATSPRLDTALAALRAGAYDYLTWPQPVDALAMALDRAVQHRRLRREVKRLRRALNPGARFDGLIGESPAMRELFTLMGRVASSKSTVLVTGETGTGKELVARALHRAGKRADGPFVAINCAALPEPLLESELFGHAKGAFTGAGAPREGLFVAATGGTLFLDELGDMPASTQVKVLRALQDRVVRPVGSNKEHPFDTRIVCATNRDLEAMVEAGTFRRDLYYRVNVIHVELPPLRARGGDILLLAEHFLEQACVLAEQPRMAIADDAARRLLEYPWPGNIRELENAVERGVALAGEELLELADLPTKVRNWTASHVLVAGSDPEELVSLRTMEARYIRRVLAAAGGNRTSAARILGIDRKSLYRKLQRLGLGPEESTG